MSSKLIRLTAAAAAIWASSAAGQYVVSAMAGFIHYADGEVFLEGKPIAPKPTEFLHAQEGQRLRTGAGRAELMLSPGSFVRLGPSSELEMVSAGLLTARLRLHAGSLLVDLVDVLEDGAIVVETGDAEIFLVKPGLYRFDAPSGTDPSMQVIRGRARASVSEAKPRNVKGDRELLLVADAKPLKTGDQEPDDLRRWSEERAALLGRQAKAARKEQLAGMDPAERALLEMIMHRPSPQPSSGSRQGAGAGAGSSGSRGSSGSSGGSRR